MKKDMAFVIDLKRCIGCDTCIVACKTENVVPGGNDRLKVLDASGDPILEKPQGVYPDFSQYWLPTMCHHCEQAPCAQVCPTNSLWRREDGVVMLDADKCVGCLRCEEACPYDALSFNTESGQADKCTLCEHRLGENQQPSCELVCPTRAIMVGDLADPESNVAKAVSRREHKVLAESSGAGPHIFYLDPWG